LGSSILTNSKSETIAVLISGGLDSSILVGDLLRQGRGVQPIYIRTGVVWQSAELLGLERFLAAIATSQLAKLLTLELPVTDLYGHHWSLSGQNTPASDSPDEAVYLPGRNALLLVKPVIWCQMHGIPELALAPLGTSPFDDASAAFLRDYESALNRGSPSPVRLLRPFGEMNKRQVMALGHELPLELTFSCISPINHHHCGRCNKCAERQAAFRDAAITDKTPYSTDN